MGLFDWLRRMFGLRVRPVAPPAPARPVLPPAPAPPPQAPPAPPTPPLPPRRYHLGLDWGTSTTKMVLRDYGAKGSERGLAYVLEPEGQLRIPSTVVLSEGRLWFGWEAERRRERAQVWDSLKATAGAGRRWQEDAGVGDLRYEDLVALSLTHYIGIGWSHAQKMAVDARSRPVLGMTLGVPAWEAQNFHQPYLRAAAVAYRLAVREGWEPQGQRLEDCAAKLAEGRAVALPGLDLSLQESERWLRAEVVAAMVWPLRSPEIGEGPYTILDVGAGTVHASWVRVHHRHDEDGRYLEKSALTVFGTRTGTSAMDAYDQALALDLGRADWRGLRGQEDRAPAGQRRAVDGVLNEMFETWAAARRDAVQGTRTPMEDWEGTGVLVVGGGSLVRRIRQRFQTLPGDFARLHEVRHLEPPSQPLDLRRLPVAAGGSRQPLDVRFLLVAYGLSLHTGDLPEIFLGGDRAVGRQPSPRGQPTSEELGYDNP